ncbi:MAG TPA: Xaa-Pro peptidase family protein, partial [Candidatus Caenarcaniphilales bacterium]|nr:Xaa-Pro peptidase family protein [Candidatus Caenarcaniphilales bacterium]
MTSRLPQVADVERWLEADRRARPARVARLRERLAGEGLDGYFGVRRENTRYLTGFDLGEGEEKVAGNSGQFFISSDEVVVLADSRYTLQAGEQCPDARIEHVYHDFAGRWPELLAGLRPIHSSNGVRRLAVEAGFVSHAAWQRLAAGTPGVELVPVEGWVEEQRQTKEPAEIERIGAACAVADAALTALLPRIMPGVTEAELALELEWLMRTGGAEAVAFGVACLGGPRAALPHGSPGPRPVAATEVLLFDFGAQVCGYRSDMTRTLFVGEPSRGDLEIYRLVAGAQQEALTVLGASASAGRRPDGRTIDAVARGVITAAGR